VDFFAPHLEPVDIGFGGLRIYSDEEYAVGAYLRLDIFFPRAAAVTFTAEVMWIRASAQGAPARFDVGLAFVGLAPDALELLQPFLESAEEDATFAPEPTADLIPPPAESAVDIDLETEPPVSEPSLGARPAPTARLGPEPQSMLAMVPVLVAGADHLRAARLDPRAGFMLALIDGVATVESLLDLSGMPPEETLGILQDLRARAIIVLRPRTLEL
jgi:hypothetical protein